MNDFFSILVDFLSKPWWGGIEGITGILALIVATIALVIAIEERRGYYTTISLKNIFIKTIKFFFLLFIYLVILTSIFIILLFFNNSIWMVDNIFIDFHFVYLNYVRYWIYLSTGSLFIGWFIFIKYFQKIGLFMAITSIIIALLIISESVAANVSITSINFR